MHYHRIGRDHRIYFHLDHSDNGFEKLGGTKKTLSNEIIDLSNAKIDKILSLNITKIKIDSLNYEEAHNAEGRFLFIEFGSGETHASIIRTSLLADGSELFTLRFGIQTLGSPRPAYNGIALIRRYPDGIIITQEPLKKSEDDAEIPTDNRDEVKKIYTSQLEEISGKIGKYSGNTLLHSMENIVVSRNQGGVIYDISEQNNTNMRKFLIIFHSGTQNIECQVSIYKNGSEDIIEVHSLVRDGKWGMDHFMTWLIQHGIHGIKHTIGDSNLLKSEENILIYLTRDEKHDIRGEEHENLKPLKDWKRLIGRIQERQKLR